MEHTRFALTRSRPDGASVEEGKVIFLKGKGTVKLSPLELVTLRSDRQ